LLSGFLEVLDLFINEYEVYATFIFGTSIFFFSGGVLCLDYYEVCNIDGLVNIFFNFISKYSCARLSHSL